MIVKAIVTAYIIALAYANFQCRKLQELSYKDFIIIISLLLVLALLWG